MSSLHKLKKFVTMLLMACCTLSVTTVQARQHHSKHKHSSSSSSSSKTSHRTIHEDVVIEGSLEVQGNIEVYGQGSIGSSLSVGKDLHVVQDADVGRLLHVGANADVKGNLDVLGNLTVGGDEKVLGDLDVSGDGSFADVSADNITTGTLSAESVAANDLSGCLVRTPNSVLGEERTIFRDQFRRDELLGMMQRLVQDYLAGNESWITIPDYGWQGVDPISSLQNMPKKTILVSSLTDDTFLETFIMLSSILYYELEDLGRFYNLSTDIKDTTFENSGKADYSQAIVTMSQYLLDKIANSQLSPDDTHRIALRLNNSYFKSLTNFYGNSLYRFTSDWSQLYSACKHKFYNEIFHDNFIAFGELDQLWYDWNYIYAATLPVELGRLQSQNLKTVQQAWLSDYRAVQELRDNEKQGLGHYFWPRFMADPTNSKAYVQNVDVEGYVRSPEFSLLNYDKPGQALSLSPLADMAKPFKELSVQLPIGGTAFTYADNDNEGLFGYETFLRAGLSEEEVNQALCESETIYNTLIRPIFLEILDVAKQRQKESHDDDYPGAWRAKIQVIKQVLRNNDGFSEAFITPYDGSVDVQVPMDPQDNASYAASQALLVSPSQQAGEALLMSFFETKQADIQEMDRWLQDMLENTLDMHSGDAFPVLKKINTGKNIVNGSPYDTIEQVIQNYGAEEKIIGVDGQLPDLVYQNGLVTTDFLYDVKEFLANLWVVQNYQSFGFSSVPPDGILLFTTNDQNVQVTYQMAIDNVTESALNALSDVEALGRHYGYNADGSIKADEWSGSNLLYKFSAPDTTNQLKQFDYIYRQHYAYNQSGPLVPSNIIDPVTHKTYYQYTDAGDEARRASFIAAYSALETLTLTQVRNGKKGSYQRWKLDWVFQEIAGYVINTAGPKGLLPQSFADQYFVDHFVNTNNPPPVLPSIQVLFRAKGSLGTNVFSQSSTDSLRNTFTVTITMETIDPKTNVSIQNRLGLMLHEGALGHGFDNVPNAVDYLNGVIPELSWLTSGSFPNAESPIEYWNYPLLRPGLVTINEGWATFGELMGLTYGYYLNFDNNGHPIPDTFDVLSAEAEIIQLSRVASRQIIAVAENFSKYAWTLNRCVNTFTDTSNITVAAASGYHSRFTGSPMQQTGYAAGLVTNLGLVSIISQELANQNKCFDFAKYVQFRIQRTDYILGATLVEVALDNLDYFEGPCFTQKQVTCPFTIEHSMKVAKENAA